MHISKLYFGLGTSLAAKTIAVFLVMLLQLYLARMLTLDEYGIFALLQTICYGLALYGQAGMLNSYMLFMSQQEDIRNVRQLTKLCLRIIKGNLIRAFFCYGLISCTLYFLDKLSNLVIFISFGVYLLITTYIFVLLAWYRAAGKAYIASLYEQGAVAGMTIIVSFVMHNYFGLPITLQSISVCFSLSSVLIVVRPFLSFRNAIRRESSSKHKIDEAKIKKTSQTFLIIQILNFGLSWGGVIVAGYFLSGSDVALLNISQRICQSVAFFLVAFNGVLAPKLAYAYFNNEMRVFNDLAKKGSLLIAFFSIPIVMVIIFWSEPILLLIGEEYINARFLLIIILCGQVINVFTGPVDYLLTMTGHETIYRNIVLFSAITFLFISITATISWGVIGASVSVVTGLATMKLLSSFYVYKKIGLVVVPGLQWLGKDKV